MDDDFILTTLYTRMHPWQHGVIHQSVRTKCRVLYVPAAAMTERWEIKDEKSPLLARREGRTRTMQLSENANDPIRCLIRRSIQRPTRSAVPNQDFFLLPHPFSSKPRPVRHLIWLIRPWCVTAICPSPPFHIVQKSNILKKIWPLKR